MSEKVYYLGKGVLSRKGRKDIHTYDEIPKGTMEQKALDKMVKTGLAGKLPKPSSVNSEVSRLKKQLMKLSDAFKELQKETDETKSKLKTAGEEFEKAKEELGKAKEELEAAKK